GGQRQRDSQMSCSSHDRVGNQSRLECRTGNRWNDMIGRVELIQFNQICAAISVDIASCLGHEDCLKGEYRIAWCECAVAIAQKDLYVGIRGHRNSGSRPRLKYRDIKVPIAVEVCNHGRKAADRIGPEKEAHLERSYIWLIGVRQFEAPVRLAQVNLIDRGGAVGLRVQGARNLDNVRQPILVEVRHGEEVEIR